MTLGRPTMTTHASSALVPSLADDTMEDDGDNSPNVNQQTPTPTEDTYFVQSIKLSTVLEQILNRVYQPWMRKSPRDDLQSKNSHQSFDTIIDLDSQLTEFEADVPVSLNWNKSPADLEPLAIPSGMTGVITMQRNVLHGR